MQREPSESSPVREGGDPIPSSASPDSTRSTKLSTGGALFALVAVSSLLRIWLGVQHPAPFVFFDEIVYSDLAQGLATSGRFELRGEPTRGFGLAYPYLLSIAYRMQDEIGLVYVTAKIMNGVVCFLDP